MNNLLTILKELIFYSSSLWLPLSSGLCPPWPKEALAIGSISDKKPSYSVSRRIRRAMVELAGQKLNFFEMDLWSLINLER